MWCNFQISALYKTQVTQCQTKKLDVREWRVFAEPVTPNNLTVYPNPNPNVQHEETNSDRQNKF